MVVYVATLTPLTMALGHVLMPLPSTPVITSVPDPHLKRPPGSAWIGADSDTDPLTIFNGLEK